MSLPNKVKNISVRTKKSDTQNAFGEVSSIRDWIVQKRQQQKLLLSLKNSKKNAIKFSYNGQNSYKKVL